MNQPTDAKLNDVLTRPEKMLGKQKGTALVPLGRPPTLLDRVAARLSDIISPPLVSLPVALAVTRQEGISWRSAIGWAGLFWTGTGLLPLFYLFRLWLRGQVTDIHVRVRQQRLRPLAMTLVSMAGTLLALALVGAPLPLLRLGIAIWVQWALLTLITFRWQISMHGAAMGTAATIFWSIQGMGSWPVLTLVPIVGWARVRLRRHTKLQVAAGAALGALTTAWLAR